MYVARDELRPALAKKAGYTSANAVFRGGKVWQEAEYAELSDLAGNEGLSATGRVTYGDLDEQFVQAGFGAHLVDVRVKRALSVVGAGRILNPLTARSQCLGGMTMGIGSALMEELHVDSRLGLFMNHDLGEYHVPVHADIPDMDVLFLDELDDASSLLRAKGLGELGISGVGRPWRTPSTTPPACGCAGSPSRSTRCWWAGKLSPLASANRRLAACRAGHVGVLKRNHRDQLTTTRP